MTNNDKYADLHVHTTFSDGLFTPGEVVEHALDLGLGAVAITDHDCVDGVLPAIEAAQGTGLEVIPGIELSASCGDSEIHILGYFLDPADEELLGSLGRMTINRRSRMEEMIGRLADKGLKVDREKVFSQVKDGTVGRMHLARAMVAQKIAGSVREVFDRYIGDGKPFHIRHKRLDHKDAIAMIKRAGGVPVLAHPGNMGRDEDIPLYVEAGLEGIEASHSEHSGKQSAKYLEMTERYHIIATGGSDCHGYSKWGTSKKEKAIMGRVTVPRETVERLRAVSERIRRDRG